MIAGGGNGGEIILDVLGVLLNIVSIGAELLNHLLQGSGPFSVVGKLATWLSGAITVFGAIVNCSGIDIFIVLVPLMLSIVWLMIIGPLGLALAIYLRLALGLLIGLFAGRGTSDLIEQRCREGD